MFPIFLSLVFLVLVDTILLTGLLFQFAVLLSLRFLRFLLFFSSSFIYLLYKNKNVLATREGYEKDERA